MAEFEEKLNALLSNPDSMAQVMQMAQALSGSMGGGQGASPPESSGQAPSWQGPEPPPAAAAAPPFPFGFGGQPQGPPPASPGGGLPGGADLFSSLGGMLGGMDPKMLTRLLPLVQEFAQGQNTQAVQLLHALRPFLKEERQDKVERALQLARMIHIGKKFFAGWEV